MKAKTAKDVFKFEDIPNVGPRVRNDFEVLGIKNPKDLTSQNPLKLYRKLEKITGSKQDPCVLDTFIAVIDFMNGAPARPWFYYTKQRKQKYPLQ